MEKTKAEKQGAVALVLDLAKAFERVSLLWSGLGDLVGAGSGLAAQENEGRLD